jgi:baseplate J-like protein
MPSSSEREWVQFRRGELRESQLRDLREGLRALDNPETGLPFTDDELRRMTVRGSRYYREGDAIDLVLIGIQKRDEFFVQQIRIDRAGSAWLRSYHGQLWGESYLPAFGGSGLVTARGAPGTIWQGSTTVPDPFAVTGTDPGLRRYQVLLTATADDDGEATLVLIAIDGGDETNPVVGTEIRWTNPPVTSEPSALVVGAQFTGGLDAETDADFSNRLASRVRHKPASGNWAHLRKFARDASVSVGDAFIYPCAFYAGSVLVAVTAKRGAIAGPLARVPSFGVLAAVTAALVPPASPFFPGRAHVVVLPVQTQSSDMAVQLAQPLGSAAGWVDLEPFPPIQNVATTDQLEHTGVEIASIASQTDFRIELVELPATLLPGGVPGPITGVHLMVWDPAASAFEALQVATVQEDGPTSDGFAYRVVLSEAPTKTLAPGDWISPEMRASRSATLSQAVVAYFDSLGPGEVLAADERSVRAFRNPVPSEEFPMRAGQNVITYIAEAMGAPVSDATLSAISRSLPSLPDDPIDGPNLLTLGRFGVYPF